MRIIDKEDDDEEGLYLTGEIQFENCTKINQDLNRNENYCSQNEIIPTQKIPDILDKQKHLITVTWLESLEKVSKPNKILHFSEFFLRPGFNLCSMMMFIVSMS